MVKIQRMTMDVFNLLSLSVAVRLDLSFFSIIGAGPDETGSVCAWKKFASLEMISIFLKW